MEKMIVTIEACFVGEIRSGQSSEQRDISQGDRIQTVGRFRIVGDHRKKQEAHQSMQRHIGGNHFWGDRNILKPIGANCLCRGHGEMFPFPFVMARTRTLTGSLPRPYRGRA